MDGVRWRRPFRRFRAPEVSRAWFTLRPDALCVLRRIQPYSRQDHELSLSAPRALRAGVRKNHSSGLQMFVQGVEIIRSQFNVNPCSLLWRHADRSQMICAIVREQSNRAAFPASKYASRLSPISPHAWPISCPGCRESDILISKPSEASDVLARKFDVGQSVYLRPNLSTRNAAFGVYEIRATLPAEDGQFRYRIKSQLELHERVVKESELSTA
jgi:hypothetical protein